MSFLDDSSKESLARFLHTFGPELEGFELEEGERLGGVDEDIEPLAALDDYDEEGLLDEDEAETDDDDDDDEEDDEDEDEEEEVDDEEESPFFRLGEDDGLGFDDEDF